MTADEKGKVTVLDTFDLEECDAGAPRVIILRSDVSLVTGGVDNDIAPWAEPQIEEIIQRILDGFLERREKCGQHCPFLERMAEKRLTCLPPVSVRLELDRYILDTVKAEVLWPCQMVVDFLGLISEAAEMEKERDSQGLDGGLSAAMKWAARQSAKQEGVPPSLLDMPFVPDVESYDF